MNKHPYMAAAEFFDFVKVGMFAGEALNIANKTDDKAWHKMLMTISTYCKKMTDERLACLDYKNLLTVQRRNKHSELMLYTTDQLRVNPADNGHSVEAHITVDGEDLYDLAEFCETFCLQCPQGEHVKRCHLREVLHRLGMPVARTNPRKGECEWRVDNENQVVNPATMEGGNWAKGIV